MSSTYTLYPSSVADSTPARQDRVHEPRSLPSDDAQHQIPPSTPVASGTHLSAFSPQFRLRSSSSSPALHTHTPADSTTLSINYQSSDFSDVEDPYFGVDFDATEGNLPSFLEDSFNPVHHEVNVEAPSQSTADLTQHAPQHRAGYYPLSPIKTPSLHTASPNGDRKDDLARFPGQPQDMFVTHALTELQPFPNFETPDGSGSGQSSEDGLAPAPNRMPAQSPRLTVSMWGRDGAGVPLSLDTTQHYEGYGDIAEVSGAYGDDPVSAPATVRDGTGRWVPDSATGQGGLGPQDRPTTEGLSINELDHQRKSAERKQQVGSWVERARSEAGDPHDAPQEPVDLDKNLPQLPHEDIDPHAETQNKMVPGQLYISGNGGELTDQDVELIRRNRNWEAAPLPFEITRTRLQPATAQDAIAKFERMYRDTDSVVSVAATWGTRRRSLPSIDDIKDVTSGNLFSKLTMRGDTPRRPSLLGGFRALVRKPSATLIKRPRESEDNRSIGTTDSSTDKSPALAPPSRVGSWGKSKNTVPSINTAFVAMGSSVASIGTTHARNGSISAATPTITSPRSASGFTLNVKRPIRLRSSSELTKPSSSSLADMWKKTGGPPVASLVNTQAAAAEAAAAMDADDDDDEDEDMYEDAESRSEANKMMDEITPDLQGFRQHILKLNPGLATENSYLVDRIAHQQIGRYKGLLNTKVKHLQATAVHNCAAGELCITLGGTAHVIDAKGDARGMDPSGKYDSDGDITPLEGPGVITQDSFPVDIPMPPTTILPAQFECQLCFQAKKFQKPSDWTKHVHEDVQPFTCTWDRCRDPKVFKRKADWVRHENEGHRHLEWWDCDFEDCRHVCYRRDNFLQHLVREHKYTEPKVKTKAAIKRAGGQDPTWQKVEQCHKETRRVANDEPCRFCGKRFPTWKKLTVHLAKHMEQISLPILKLVARKELEPDTIISPVQEPPPRSFPAIFPGKSEPQLFDTTPMHSHPSMNHPLAHHLTYPPPLPQHQHQHHPQPRQQHHPQPAPYLNYIPSPAQQQQQQFSSPLFPTLGGFGTTGLDHSPIMAPTHSGAVFPNLDMSTSYPVTSHMSPSNGNNGNAYTNLMPPGSSPYIPSDIDQFSAALGVNALGLQNNHNGGPAGGVGLSGGFNGIDHQQQQQQGLYSPDQQRQQQQQHYTPQGSVSPYGHSPLQGQGGFYQ